MGARTVGVATMMVTALLWAPRPAAAQVGACAVPTGPQLPNLIVEGHLLPSQLTVTVEKFLPSSCSVVEGVTKQGKQVILRFNSSTPNVGDTDMFIGDPAQCPTLFEFSDCHQHLHFIDYSAYRIWTVGGYANWVAMRDPGAPTNSGINAQLLASATTSGDLISGHKQGFCMVDSGQYSSNAGPAKYLSCSSNQGISVGWEDIYPPYLPDQFIAISNLSEGDYVLENQVNPNQLLPETQYADNFASVKIHYIQPHGNMPPSVQVIP